MEASVLTVFLLFATICPVYPWSGHVCSRNAIHYYNYSYCSAWIWGWCIHYRNITRAYYANENYCCPGWNHNGNENCNIPTRDNSNVTTTTMTTST